MTFREREQQEEKEKIKATPSRRPVDWPIEALGSSVAGEIAARLGANIYDSTHDGDNRRRNAAAPARRGASPLLFDCCSLVARKQADCYSKNDAEHRVTPGPARATTKDETGLVNRRLQYQLDTT